MARRLVPTRAAARRAILEGRVEVEGVAHPRPASTVSGDAVIRIVESATRYVSRGGEKLEHALDRFGVPVAGRRAIDVGASSGGFSDCLLQRGAASVLAVDVGTDQLHPKLAADARLDSMEQTDIRDFAPDAGGGPFDLILVDVSFISAASLAGKLATLGHPASDWVVLIKPQFEVGPGGRDRRGVVTDPALRADAVAAALRGLGAGGLRLRGFSASPLTGGSGNLEFLAWLRRRHDLAHVTGGDDDDVHG